MRFMKRVVAGGNFVLGCLFCCEVFVCFRIELQIKFMKGVVAAENLSFLSAISILTVFQFVFFFLCELFEN